MIKRLAIILAILAATVGYAIYQKQSLESQLSTGAGTEAILKKMPEANFKSLTGEVVSLDSLYPADLVIVHYWGTWCAPCEAELPDLLSFIKRFKDQRNVKFILVAVNDDLVKVQKHIKALPLSSDMNITWLMDNDDVHRKIFGTTRVPETYVFSSDKLTLKKYLGPQEWNKTMFFQTFDEFLQMSQHKL